MIAVVIMASGYSRRMGQDKLKTNLLGKPMLQWVIEAAKGATTEHLAVIYRDPDILTICETCGVSAVYNADAQEGQSASIRLAVRRFPEAQAYLFLAGDQPLITPKTLLQILERYRQEQPDIISAAWQGKRTLPALFSHCLAADLLKLKGDQGGRALIESGRFQVLYQELCGEQERWDIDTLEELTQVEAWLNARGQDANDEQEAD